MKSEYDLSKMKSRKNPYAAKLKKPARVGTSCVPTRKTTNNLMAKFFTTE